MLIKWIKSALLPACSPILSTRHLRRYGAKREGLSIKKVPREYFHEQIYTTFFNHADAAPCDGSKQPRVGSLNRPCNNSLSERHPVRGFTIYG
jgi:hypothetical protein